MNLSIGRVLILAAVLFGCSPLQKDPSGQASIENPPMDDDAEGALKVAYSMDDITAVKIIPEKLQVEPWQPVQLFLAGTLPDKTQGRIPSEVTWSVDNSKVGVIGKVSGELIASREGHLTITSKFRKFQDTRTLEVRWLSRAGRILPEPDQLVGSAVDGNIVKLEWRFGDGPVTGHQLVYRKGAAPGNCDVEAGGDVGVVPAATILDMTEVTVVGLEPAISYGFRLCSVQELSTDDEVVRRFSSGITTSIKTKNE